MPRSRDRLDHRLAEGRLRARHVRAAGRALAERGAGRRGLAAAHVFVDAERHVAFAGRARRGEAGEAVASLARDLAARGAARRAEQLVAAYALAADDYGVYARIARARGPRALFVVGGLVASGKSTAAKAVSRHLAAPLVEADQVRAALLDAAEAPHELAWAPALAQRVYAGLLERAGLVLASGRSVVLDACFASETLRDLARSLARTRRARFVLAWCDAPAEDVVARLRRRDLRDGAAPGGWERIARAVEVGAEPPRPRERAVRLDTRLAPAAWLRALGLAPAEAA